MRVDFLQNGVVLGSDTTSPYSFTWNNVTNGTYTLTAKAVDNKGATTTSSGAQISVKTSPKSVNRAKGRGATLLDSSGSTAIYAGAADLGTSPETISLSQLVADFGLLEQDIQTAYNDFLIEKSSFGANAERIDSQLQAALYFCRGDAALAAKSGPSQSVWGHLRRLVAHLAMTEELMLYGNVSAATLNEARAANARTDVVIGAASLSYGPGAAPVVAPGSMVSAFANLGLTPFGSQLLFAPLTGLTPWELAGVNVTVGGFAVPVIYTSPGRIAFYLPTDLPMGAAEVIITCHEGYVTRGTVTVARNVSQIMTTNDASSGPATAVNGSTKVSGPFNINTTNNFGSDTRTRVTFFATGISGSVANTDMSNDSVIDGVTRPNFAESVIVEARTATGQVVRLPVEFAGVQGILPGVDQVTVVLTPNLKNAGTVQLTLILNGQTSNTATVVIN